MRPRSATCARSTAYPVRCGVVGSGVRPLGGRGGGYQLTAAFLGRKAVGEADSFPYRLITNYPSILLRSTAEAVASGAVAVSEFDAVPR